MRNRLTLATAGGVGRLLAVTTFDVTTGAVTGVYLPLYDAHGDITGLIDQATGAVVASYSYTAFGERTAVGPKADVSPWGWQSEYQEDQVGLILFEWRAYDPALGRFLQRDPLREGGGLNLYAYCDNDAINAGDPLGLEDTPVATGAVGFRGSPAARARVLQKNVEVYLTQNPDLLKTPSVQMPANVPGWMAMSWQMHRQSQLILNADMAAAADDGDTSRLTYLGMKRFTAQAAECPPPTTVPLWATFLPFTGALASLDQSNNETRAGHVKHSGQQLTIGLGQASLDYMTVGKSVSGLSVLGMAVSAPPTFVSAPRTLRLPTSGAQVGAGAVEAGEIASSTSLRLQYMGSTPGKMSRTGLEVQARMQAEGNLVRVGDKTMVRYYDGGASRYAWTEIVNTDMAHRVDAVSWWNSVGIKYGPKAPEVRSFMLDPKNYELQPYWINRSKGALLTEQYQKFGGG